MLRIKDPKITVPYYQNNFGMKLLSKFEFNEAKFSIYFMGILPSDVNAPDADNVEESTKFLFNYQGTLVELVHNHGTETDDNFKANNGNVEPNRGFGHLAFSTNDVYASCAKLEANEVKFQKKPDEGRMKGLAFALDPDGYWLEIISRSQESNIQTDYNLAQTMIRVKDPEKSLHFYTQLIGMTLVAEKHFPDNKFSLYFLASLPKDTPVADPKSEQASQDLKKMFNPVLELTHNHGTESDPNFKYHNGNDDPKGYGHIAFLVDDVNAAVNDLEAANIQFKKKPSEGLIKGISFAYDLDGYWVEIIQRGLNPKPQ